MKNLFSRVVFMIFLFSFTFSVLKMSTVDFSELSEDTLEELVKLSEEESEKEFTFEYSNNSFDFSPIKGNFQYFNVAQLNNIIASHYTEPHQENLFSPPENIV